jgi:histidine triad (HIT) family protein
VGDDCIFCRILSGSVPARFVHQGDDVVAFDDIQPQAPTHVLVIPREHIPRSLDLEAEHAPLIARIFEAAIAIARARGLEQGFRLVINDGPAAGQSVDHLHLHVLGGRPMRWPPG